LTLRSRGALQTRKEVDKLRLGGDGVIVHHVDRWLSGLLTTLRRWCRSEGTGLMWTRSGSGGCSSLELNELGNVRRPKNCSMVRSEAIIGV
jgi:hypothetical protein